MPWSQLNLCFSLASLATFLGFRGQIVLDLMHYVPFYFCTPLVLACVFALLLVLFTLIGAWKRKGPPLLISVPLFVTNLLSASFVVLHAYSSFSAAKEKTLDEIMNIGVLQIVEGVLIWINPMVQSLTLLLLMLFVAELTTRIKRKPSNG